MSRLVDAPSPSAVALCRRRMATTHHPDAGDHRAGAHERRQESKDRSSPMSRIGRCHEGSGRSGPRRRGERRYTQRLSASGGLLRNPGRAQSPCQDCERNRQEEEQENESEDPRDTCHRAQRSIERSRLSFSPSSSRVGSPDSLGEKTVLLHFSSARQCFSRHIRPVTGRGNI